MAIKQLLILLPALVIANTGFARFDAGIGSVHSPFGSLVLVDETPALTGEIALTNLYGFSPAARETQFFATGWGAMGGRGKQRWRVTMTHLEAFGIWRELSPEMSYSLAPTYRFRLEFTAGGTLLMVPNDRDGECAVAVGTGFQLSRIKLAGIYRLSHISAEPDRSIPLGELTLVAAVKESRMGSQGIAIHWNHTDLEYSFSVVESFAPVDWFRLNVTLSSVPFELGLSVILGKDRSKMGVLMSRHSDLGWSQTAAVNRSFIPLMQ